MLFLLLVACGTQPATPDIAPFTEAEAAEAAAQTICAAAHQAGQPCAASGSTATMAKHTLELGATVNSFLTLDPRTIGYGDDAEKIPGEVQLSVTLSLSVDGATLLTEEQSHAASDADLPLARAKALDEWAQRWVAAYGLATLDAVAGDASAPALGELHAWAAYPVLHGQGFDPKIANKMAPYVKSMLAALGPFTEGLTTEGLHTVQVKARLGGGGAPGPCGILPPVSMTPGVTVSIVPLHGEVLVDGQPTGDICTLSEPVAWPLPQGNARLEWDQLAVLGVAKAVEASVEEEEPPAAP